MDLLLVIARVYDCTQCLVLLFVLCTSTGLANPAPIIQTFYAEENIFNEVKLDGVVTLVDAKHAGFHLDEVKPKGVVNEAVEQIAYADRIIVNKVLANLFLLWNGFSFAEMKHLDYLRHIGFDLATSQPAKG